MRKFEMTQQALKDILTCIDWLGETKSKSTRIKAALDRLQEAAEVAKSPPPA
jgi:hypothetical protein